MTEEIPTADRDRIDEKAIRDMTPDLEALLDLLDRHDIDARSSFASLKERLRESAPYQAGELARLIDRFDFGSAGNTLRELMERVNSNAQRY